MPSVVIDGVTKIGGEHRPGWVDYPTASALDEALRRPVCDRQRRRCGGARRDAVRGRRAARSGVVFVLTLGTGRRIGDVQRRRARPEHRARPHGDPRAATRSGDRRRSPGSGAACRGRPGRRPRRAPQRDRQAVLAEPDHPGRRGQQERRQVHPAPDRPRRRSCRPTLRNDAGIVGAALSWPPGWRPPERRAPARVDRLARPRRPVRRVGEPTAPPRPPRRWPGPSQPRPPSSRRRSVRALRPIARSTASRSAPRPKRSGRSSTIRLRSAGSMPGCESIVRETPDRFVAVVASKVKFMTVRSDVVATLHDADPPRHLRLVSTARPRGLGGSFRLDVRVRHRADRAGPLDGPVLGRPGARREPVRGSAARC